MADWTKEMFDLAYDFNAEPEGHPNTRPGIRLHYNRYVMYPELLRRAQFFVSHFNLTAADRILVVGAGFGWTVEALQGMGLTVIGTDISPYIIGNKDLSEDSEISAAITAVGLSPTSGEGLAHFNRLRGDGVRSRGTVLNEDSSSNQSRNRVKAALGSSPTIAITEDVLTSLSDAECVGLQTQILKYAPTLRVCHFVTELANPNPPFSFNSKTIEEWKALFPTATIVADGYTYKVL